VAWPRFVRATPEPIVNCGLSGTEAAGAAGSSEHPPKHKNSSNTGSRDMGHLPVQGSSPTARRCWPSWPASSTGWLGLLGGLPEARGDYRYAAGKWSVKEVVGHLADTERVFAYRAPADRPGGTRRPCEASTTRRTCRSSALGTSGSRTWSWSGHVRRASLALYRHLPPGGWQRRGIASEQPISVRAGLRDRRSHAASS
jgi:hypothetical protein